MNRNIRRLSFVLAGLAMTTAVAYAADSKVPAKPADFVQQFEVIDANKNGVLTMPEIEDYGGKALSERLKKCDTNKDSVISREELTACKVSARAEVGIAP